MPPKRRAAAPAKDEVKTSAKRMRKAPEACSSKSKERSDLLEQLNKKFMYHHTEDLEKFWEFAKELNSASPCDAFSGLNDLKLVGVFRYLNGERSENDSDYVIWDRFKTDLPEMQTIMTHKNGRFAFWRDSSDDCPILVHVDSTKNFPKIEVIGSGDPFFAVAHLIEKDKDAAAGAKFLPDPLDSYKTTLKTVLQKRKKEAVGRAFHGPKIRVPIRGDVGYRPVSDNPAKLKKKLETFMTTEDNTVKANLRNELLELKSYVDFANDEMDYGMGLEFGHDLFLANNAVFENLAFRMLETAYTLLERTDYVELAKKIRSADGKRLGEE